MTIMNSIFLVLLILVGIIVFWDYNTQTHDRKEKYSQAAITQLIAKGPQDTYLSGDAWKYIPPYGYPGYISYGGYGYYPYGYYGSRYYRGHSGYPWNISTRLGGYYY